MLNVNSVLLLLSLLLNVPNLPENCKSIHGTNICDTTVTRTADLHVHLLFHSHSHTHTQSKSLHLSTNDFSEFSTLTCELGIF